jgi:Leucine-rich repeat (LRR) protein
MSALLAIAVTTSVVPRLLLVQRTTRDVVSLGGRLTVNQQRFSLLDRMTGWGDAVHVELEGSRTRDQDVERLVESLSQLGSVKYLNLSGTGVTDGCLPSVAELTGLSSLQLANTRVRGHGFERLQALKLLHEVNLDGTLIDDAGVASLARIPNLTTLNIDNTNVTNEGVMHLSRLSGLETLSAANTGLTESGVLQLVESHPELAIFDD